MVGTTGESRFFELPRDRQNSSKDRGFRKIEVFREKGCMNEKTVNIRVPMLWTSMQ